MNRIVFPWRLFCLSVCLSVCQWINDSNETEKVTGPNSSCVLSLNFYIPRREDDVFFRFCLVSLFIYLFIFIYYLLFINLIFGTSRTSVTSSRRARTSTAIVSWKKKKQNEKREEINRTTQNCNFRMLNQLAQRMFSSWLILQTFTKHSNHHVGKQCFRFQQEPSIFTALTCKHVENPRCLLLIAKLDFPPCGISARKAKVLE